MLSLFDNESYLERPIAGITILRHHWSKEQQHTMLAMIRTLVKAAPFFTPKMNGGQNFTQQLTNCGEWGWVAGEQPYSGMEFIGEKHGYRYQRIHPVTGKPWPAIPPALASDARAIAQTLGETEYQSQSCLINYYPFPNGKLGMHQDRTEQNLRNAIITYSLGDSCVFRVGTTMSEAGGFNVKLHSGDVCIMHGAARMAWHGVSKLFPTTPQLLRQGGRISLTVRMVTNECKMN